MCFGAPGGGVGGLFGLNGGGCLLPKKELEEKHLGHVGSSERGNILFFLFFSILGIILSPTLLVFTLAMK